MLHDAYGNVPPSCVRCNAIAGLDKTGVGLGIGRHPGVQAAKPRAIREADEKKMLKRILGHDFLIAPCVSIACYTRNQLVPSRISFWQTGNSRVL